MEAPVNSLSLETLSAVFRLIYTFLDQMSFDA